MKKILLAGVAFVGFAGAAMAADLPARTAPAPVYAPAIPVFTWTGFYVGVNAGYGWNTNNSRTFDPVLGYYGDSGSDGGFVGGGQIGYNYQMGQFVIGAETDIQYADLGTDRGYYGNFGGSSSGNWFGTLRARAGFAIDRALIYATGGLAYGDIGGNNSIYNPALGYYLSNGDSTKTGWVLGGGVEYAFTNNLTAKVEGLYVNLGSDNGNDYPYLAGVGYSGKRDTEFGVVRAGLNYKFNTY